MAHRVQTVNYTLSRGLPWERLIIIRERFNHWLLKPTDARAYIKTGDLTLAEVTVTITSENGLMLSLTAEETQDLPTGDLSYDVWATIGGIQRPISKGTITVSALDNISPLEDALAMEIRFKKYTDFRQAYTWKDDNGTTIAVTDAFMQAKNAAGTTVVDLRWFSTIPDEATIIALPAARRGYIAPKSGYTLEIHISNENSVPAGAYSYDLFVKDTAGDWSSIAQGNLVVEPATSAPPV